MSGRTSIRALLPQPYCPPSPCYVLLFFYRASYFKRSTGGTDEISEGLATETPTSAAPHASLSGIANATVPVSFSKNCA